MEVGVSLFHLIHQFNDPLGSYGSINIGGVGSWEAPQRIDEEPGVLHKDRQTTFFHGVYGASPRNIFYIVVLNFKSLYVKKSSCKLVFSQYMAGLAKFIKVACHEEGHFTQRKTACAGQLMLSTSSSRDGCVKLVFMRFGTAHKEATTPHQSIIKRSKHRLLDGLETKVNEGDVIAIFPPAGGGEDYLSEM